MHPKLIILTAVAFFIGYMVSVSFHTPAPVKLDSTPYCLHSEYDTMKIMTANRPPLSDAMVTVDDKVRVWVRCPQ
jgi:hypothetical protein